MAAVVDRLDGFETAIAAADAGRATPRRSRSRGRDDGRRRHRPRGPRGAVCRTARRWSRPMDFSFARASATLVTGPSGAGKSTLFRAIAGHLAVRRGAIAVPAGATLMMLPQRPYFPIGSLAAAVGYPAEQRDVQPKPDRRALIEAVGLPAARVAARRGGALEPHAVAGRAAAPRARPRAAARAATTCSSTRRPPRSTSRRKLRCTACLRRSCRTPPSSRSATARRWRHSTSATSYGARRRSLRAEGRQAGVGSVGCGLVARMERRAIRATLTASAAAMAGRAPRGARDSRTRSKAPRRPAPAPAGTSMADCPIPPAAG